MISAVALMSGSFKPSNLETVLTPNGSLPVNPGGPKPDQLILTTSKLGSTHAKGAAHTKERRWETVGIERNSGECEDSFGSHSILTVEHRQAIGRSSFISNEAICGTS